MFFLFPIFWRIFTIYYLLNKELFENEDCYFQVQTLTKSERVMLETADNVIATKKRVEYGVHQILMEVGELIKLQNKNMNRTIIER